LNGERVPLRKSFLLVIFAASFPVRCHVVHDSYKDSTRTPAVGRGTECLKEQQRQCVVEGTSQPASSTVAVWQGVLEPTLTDCSSN
jgi:hypothetical protein